MPLPVIENVYRVALEFTNNSGGHSTNVLHVRTLMANVDEIAIALDAATVADMWYPLATPYHLDSWNLTPLDGVSPTFTLPASSGNNGNGGNVSSNATAAVLKLSTGIRGPRGRGRLFIGPAGESVCESGEVSSVARESAVEGWNTWGSTLFALDPDPIEFVVASYTHEDANSVVNISMDARLGNQRRRQRQVG